MDQGNSRYISRFSMSQERRFTGALDFDYAPIDERSLKDLLLYTFGFSKLIYYFNLENKPDGDWSDFLNDEIVILATVSEIKPNLIEKKFKTDLYKAENFRRPVKKIQYLKYCLKEIYQAADLLDQWLSRFKEVEKFANVYLESRNEIIYAISDSLKEPFQLFKAICDGIASRKGLNTPLDFDFSRFSFYWKLEESPERPDLFDSKSLDQKVKWLASELRGIFQTFYETLIFLKNRSQSLFNQSLKNDNHYPEVALLLSFLKLYEIPQKNINSLSKKYVDFYFRKILRQHFKAPVFDKVYLHFVPNDNALFAIIQKEMEFIGGEYENGDNIIYLADSHLQVNRATIKRIYTIFFEKKTLAQKGRERLLIQDVLSSNLSLDNLRPDPNRQIKKYYPVFGESQQDKSAYERTMQSADIGFALASPSLYLSEGEREINLTFQFTDDSFRSLEACLLDISRLSQGSEKKESKDDIFVKTFLEAFRIFLTVPEGWLEISRYVVVREKRTEADLDFNALKITFDINARQEPIVAYDEDVHQIQLDTNLPVVRILLNSNSYQYPYTLLYDLILESIGIDTHIKDVKDLILHNETGIVSPDSPFFPFGAVPQLGSYLVIGKNEIFQKSLSSLQINLEWFNLPRQRNGLLGYYEQYDADLDNAAFEIKLSILDGGHWLPAKEQDQQTFKLFQTINGGVEESDSENASPEVLPGGTLDTITRISPINIEKIKLPHNFAQVQEALDYKNTTLRGFVKLELSNPEFAFGHTLYPGVLSEIVLENSRTSLVENIRRGFSKKDLKKLPNQPFVPQIKALSLDYSSSSVINVDDQAKKDEESQNRGQFFHLYPFGNDQVYPNSSYQKVPFVPDMDYEGALLIGLEDLAPPQVITILFEIEGGFTTTSEENPPELAWSYLRQNQWRPLSESKILQDETDKFVKTGIIALELPHDIALGNTILDPNYYWLRVAVLNNISTTSRICGICTQVVTATLQNLDEEGEHLNQALPAFSVSRSVERIPGVQDVIQPIPSFMGKQAESERQFYTRISERLRHKQRAITPWDYERLILEKFPEIHKVTCLPNITSHKLDAPGNVLIVVIPKGNAENANFLERKASSEQLKRIKEFLSQYTSPFIHIEVRNPSYEKVRIMCAVKLALGYNYGYYLQTLNDEINRYLLGDMVKKSKSLELGGRINSSDVLSFMRTLPYVEFITKFSMIQIASDLQGRFVLLDTAREDDPKSFLQATKPWSMLIPANQHQIVRLEDKQELRSVQAGYDNLGIGTDFTIEKE